MNREVDADVAGAGNAEGAGVAVRALPRLVVRCRYRQCGKVVDYGDGRGGGGGDRVPCAGREGEDGGLVPFGEGIVDGDQGDVGVRLPCRDGNGGADRLVVGPLRGGARQREVDREINV